MITVAIIGWIIVLIIVGYEAYLRYKIRSIQRKIDRHNARIRQYKDVMPKLTRKGNPPPEVHKPKGGRKY